ncbi:MAG: ORF6N domain-containing protein [Bacteroidia bacterium]|nr:ORF6N domain-containing protein [Bacteroidia bacterium]
MKQQKEASISNTIYDIREQKVMLDYDLAWLYKVGTKTLNQAVKRNIKRFPPDFRFQLTQSEWESSILQIRVTDSNRSQIVTGSQKHREKTALPYAFTEQGISMLSNVLRSDTAIDANIFIMRTFVLMRKYALSHKDLTEKLKELENKYNSQFKDVYDAIAYLLQKDKLKINQKYRPKIGFKTDK